MSKALTPETNPPKALRELCEGLKALALSGDRQLALFDGVCVPCTMAARIEFLIAKARRLKTDSPPASAFVLFDSIMDRLKTTRDDPANQCYDEEYLRAGASWEAVRLAARQVLDELGWSASPIEPRREFLYRRRMIPRRRSGRGPRHE